MKKNKLIVSSVLATLMSVSLIGGATYSLFTSESTHNITVGSATIDLDSSINENKLTLYSLDKKQEGLTFANGGTASLDTSTGAITLENITPGDEVRFNLKLTNNSNVKIKYIVKITRTNSAFDDALQLTGPASGKWETLEPSATPIISEEYKIKFIDQGEDIDNTLQNETTKVNIVVEAHQFNDPALKETTITFISNEGSVVDPITQIHGTTLVAPEEPTRSGYTFDGWFTDDKTFLNEYQFTTMPTSDLTLYAKWAKIKVNRTITYIAKDGILPVGSETTKTVKEGDPVGDLPVPFKVDSNFAGWFSEDTLSQKSKITSESTMPESDLTLYAKYEPNSASLFEYEYDSNSSTYRITGLSTAGNAKTEVNFVFPAQFDDRTNGIHDVTGLPQNLFFYAEGFDNYPPIIEKVTIPGTYKSLPWHFLHGQENLVELNLNEGLETIDFYSISFTGLTAVDIPSTVKTIANNAISTNTKLETIKLPNSLTSIQTYGIENNPLKHIYINEGTNFDSLTVVENAFNNSITSETTIHLQNADEQQAWKNKVPEFNTANFA